MRRVWFVWLILLALLGGCGGASSPGAKNSVAYSPSRSGAYEPSYPTTASVERAPAAGVWGGSSDIQPAPPPPPTATAQGSSRTEIVPTPDAPRERPGLGTEWGESRTSRVRDTTFFRADSDRPFAVATVHYNDRTGVEALANFHGSSGGRFREFTTRGGMIAVSIKDGSGESLEALHVGDRTYVIGNAGDRYAVVLTNHTGHRYEVVTTVDGLDVINGRTGSLQNRGYVLMPYATLEIDGFRQSQDAVAAFRFGRVSDSYAAQTGSARNVGVIGLAFFSERGDFYSDEELGVRDTANPFPSSDPRFARPPR